MCYLSVGPGASLTRDVVCRTGLRTARGDSDILHRLHRLRTPCQHFHSDPAQAHTGAPSQPVGRAGGWWGNQPPTFTWIFQQNINLKAKGTF